MSPRLLLAGCACIALAIPTASIAQDQQGEDAPVDDRRVGPDGQILVTAERIRGQVLTDQPPVIELEEADIAAFGVNSIADLVTVLEPATGSNRGRGGGRPVFLVNGIRVGSFREFQSYPPEAIRKVEVLPEEVALKFGFPPDRRVINFILKPNFSTVTVEAEYEQPGIGGYSATEQEATLLRINEAGRLNLNIEHRDVSPLTEDERDLIQTEGSVPDVAGDPNPAEFRTLVADSESWEGSANYAMSFLESGGSLSLNLTGQRTDSLSLSGLDTVLLTAPNGDQLLRTFNADDPLAVDTRVDTISSSATYTRPVGLFQLTATADASRADTTRRLERRVDTTQLVADAAAGLVAIDGPIPVLADAGFDTSTSEVWDASAKTTLRGVAASLPAGDLSTTFDFGFDWTRIESDDTRSATASRLTRGDINGGVSVSIPIADRDSGVWDAIGDITLNGRLAFNHLSDFGTLLRWNAGVSWAPTDKLNFQATYSWREAPPALSQLGSPITQTFNVPVFDFQRGETVLATITSGGNPALQAETQSDWNFAANWELPFVDNMTLRAEYTRNRSDDVSSAFPALTDDVEAAFADRVTRDADGRLLAIDRRPVDFAEVRSDRVSFGLFWRGSFGSARPGGEGGEQGRGGPPAGMRGGAGGPPPGGGQGGPGGRFGQMSEEQREQFMQFRQRVCADDGEQYLLQLAEAVERGEAPEGMEGFDLERAQRMLSRFRGEDGTIDRERLGQFRTMICSREMPGGGQGQQAAGGERRGGGGGGGGGMMARAFGGGDGRGRFFFSLNHSIELDRTVLIAPGGPVLDLLDGDSLTNSGTPRHTSRLEAGMFRGGWGMRVSGQYVGEARIDGSGAPGTTDLFFDDLATVDLRLFADLQQVTGSESAWLKGLRASLRLDNVFDGRRRVVDSNGDTPVSFQPLLIDPTGRYIGVELRKQF
ncbi:hypothetical protein [Erythrobacter sp. HKB08]|uniref:hypothetical protein n=1 Tax=Erythrobacter sp. HKB08 TaxID=2502843 RepID=UPI0010092F19|nr:hypothetical protein [Erythrobacter sp. HKB08]